MQLSDAEIEKLRQSGIRLDADGHFWHEGAQVTHHGLRAAFWRWLDRNPDGRWVLRLDDKRFVYLDVDGAPFVVRSARWEGDRAMMRLSDDSDEELDYATLHLRAGGLPHCVVKQRFDAKVSTLAWNTLAERIEDGTLRAAGQSWPIPTRA
ncbi:MAG: hypothetical protein JWN44_3690 [Myxococcales bacterium]|nr:hypothetical protein [Myxococcales bacterium]